MQQVLVAVLVALALLQPVRPQEGTQETEENFSTNRGRDQQRVDHYLLQLNNKLDTLNSKLETLDTTLSQHKQQMASELTQLHISLNTTQSSLEQLYTLFSQHKQQTASELGQPQTSHFITQSSLETVNSKLEVIDTGLSQHKQQAAAELAQLHTSLELLHTILSQHKRETTTELAELQDTLRASTDNQQIQTNISDVECVDTEESLQLHQNLQDNLTHQLETIQNYIEQLPVHTCGGTGGWRRVVYLDMTDPSTTCPPGWQLTGYSKRTCGRVSGGWYACDSVTFPVSGGEYSRVCGRIKAYQWGNTLAFWSYVSGEMTTIDVDYVDGISVTHSTPRQHIWTFAAGAAERSPSEEWVCPCDARHTIRVPRFVGSDYFCESGVNEQWVGGSRHYTFHPNETLWDGENCLSSSTCCSLHTPPYFVKQLPTPTTDDIEARICLYYPLHYANIAVELVELYVQ